MRSVSASIFALLLLVGVSPALGEPDWDNAAVARDWIDLEPVPDPSPAAQAAASRLLAPLSEAEIGTLDALRFLLRPTWGGSIHPQLTADARLDPFTHHGQGPLSLEEIRRVWALAQAGYPEDEHLLAAISRLVETPAVVEDGWLTQPLMLMLALRAVLRRGVSEAGLRRRARTAIYDTWRQVRPWLEREYYRGMGHNLTTCYLSTVLFYRMALEFRLSMPGNFIDIDIQALGREFGRPRTVDPRPDMAAEEVRHLWAYVALSLAASAEPKRPRLAEVMERVRPEIAKRLRGNVDFNCTYGFRASLLAEFNTLGDDVIPDGFTPESWREWLNENARYWASNNGGLPAKYWMLNPRSWNWAVSQSPRGRVPSSDNLSPAFYAPPHPFPTYAQQRVLGSSLVLIGLSGGLFPPRVCSRHPAIHAITWDGPELERLMQARTIMAAVEHNRLTVEARDWIPEAIRSGARQLVRLQNVADGSIHHRGLPEHYPVAYTALSGLALLHVGYSRDSRVIRGVLQFLEDNSIVESDRMVMRNYERSCVLMFLQQFYLPEQTRARTFAQTERDARRMTWRSIPEYHRAWIDNLATAVEGAQVGLGMAWGYAIPESRFIRNNALPAPPPDPERIYRGDNSNAHYAMLGLWSAGLLGRELSPDMLRAEVERLKNEFLPDHDVRPVSARLPTRDSEAGGRATIVDPGETVPVGGWAYAPVFGKTPKTSMTAAMLINLRIAYSELKVWGTADDELEASLYPLYAGGMGYLSERVRDHLGGAVNYHNGLMRRGPSYAITLSNARSAWLMTYEMNAVSIAGTLLDVRVLHGNVDWYREGVLYLQRRLPAKGDWPCSTYEIAWILLFLKRAVPHELDPPVQPVPRAPDE